MNELYKLQIFIMGVLWGLLIFRILPSFINDIRKTIIENKKGSVVTATEQFNKKHSKYSITNCNKNFYSQDIERWSKC